MMRSPYVVFMARIVEGELFLNEGNEAEGRRVLANAMSLGNRADSSIRGYGSHDQWRASTPALEAGIEVEYVRNAKTCSRRQWPVNAAPAVLRPRRHAHLAMGQNSRGATRVRRSRERCASRASRGRSCRAAGLEPLRVIGVRLLHLNVRIDSCRSLHDG